MNSGRKRKVKPQSTVTVIPLRDRLAIFGGLAILLAVTFFLLHYGSIQLQTHRLDATLQMWRRQYHLTEQQAADIRRIEEQFHGTGSPFSKQSASSPDEVRAHHEAISGAMNPDDGARFLKATERNPRRLH